MSDKSLSERMRERHEFYYDIPGGASLHETDVAEVAALEAELAAAKAALQPFVDYYLHVIGDLCTSKDRPLLVLTDQRHSHRYAIKVGDFVAAADVAMQAAKEESQ